MYDIKQIKERVSSLRILVVDDEELIRMLMKSFMERLFGEVIIAENGEDALQKWKEYGPFDVVLTDMRMPKMTGRELIRELKRLGNTPYIIVVSGSSEADSTDSTQSDIYMEKPLGFDQILETLSKMIQNHKFMTV